jgi:TPR repeat protein
MSTRSWLILATSFVVGIGFFVYLLGTAPNSPSSSDVGPADSQLIYAIEQNRPHASLAAAVEQDKLSSGTPLSQVSRLHVPFVPAKLVPPEGSAASALEGLWDSAEQGDAAANYSIFRILQECFAKLAWGFSSSSLDCAGVSEDNLARRIEFLERAAALGEPNAQVEYVAAAGSSFEQALDIAQNLPEFQDFRQKSMRFLQAAASSGNVRAMSALAEAYERGALTTRDPVAAYAYAYAAQRSGVGADQAAWVGVLRRSLTPEQRQLGDNQASSILRTCCGL